MGLGRADLPSNKKWMQSLTMQERLRAAAGRWSAAPTTPDVATATAASAGSSRDKDVDTESYHVDDSKGNVYDANGIEEGTSEKGTKRYEHSCFATPAAQGYDNDGQKRRDICTPG